MKKLYKELAVVLGIFLAVIYFIEWRLKDIKAPVDTILALPAGNPSATILIVGNSHTGALEEASDSAFLKSSVNLSLANLELGDRLKVITYAINNGNFKMLILGMDADQIGHAYSSSIYDLQLSRYGFKLNDNTVGNSVLAHLNSFRLRLSIADLIKGLLKGKWNDNTKMNFIPFTNKERNDPEACKKRAQEHSVYAYKKANNKKNLEALQQIMDLCKGHNVKLYLLQTPKSECYSVAYSNADIQAASLQIDSIAAKNNDVFLNYFNNTQFNDLDFADYDHLNKAGGNKLIAMIKKELNN